MTIDFRKEKEKVVFQDPLFVILIPSSFTKKSFYQIYHPIVFGLWLKVSSNDTRIIFVGCIA